MISQRTFLLIILFSFISAAGGYYIGSLTKPAEFVPVVNESTTIPTADTTTQSTQEEEEEPVVTQPTPSVSTKSSTPASTKSATATGSGNVQGVKTSATKSAAPTSVKRSPSGSF